MKIDFLAGYKTYLVFGLSLLLYLAKTYAGIESIPDLDPGALALLGLFMRLITKAGPTRA